MSKNALPIAIVAGVMVVTVGALLAVGAVVQGYSEVVKSQEQGETRRGTGEIIQGIFSQLVGSAAMLGL